VDVGAVAAALKDCPGLTMLKYGVRGRLCRMEL